MWVPRSNMPVYHIHVIDQYLWALFIFTLIRVSCHYLSNISMPISQWEVNPIIHCNNLSKNPSIMVYKVKEMSKKCIFWPILVRIINFMIITALCDYLSNVRKPASQWEVNPIMHCNRHMTNQSMMVDEVIENVTLNSSEMHVLTNTCLHYLFYTFLYLVLSY